MNMPWTGKRNAHLRKGALAEQQACRFLQQQGLQLVCRNYRCRRGEIDLVMEHHGDLVFVEVRYRQSQQFGGPLESITAIKQNKLRLAAQHYLQQQKTQKNSRFDVLALSGNNRQPQIQWIQNAF